jgi:hypothetical protein
MVSENRNVEFDDRLRLPLDFVIKILDVSREDFASLALSNLIHEELDWIKHNGFEVNSKEIKGHQIAVALVKYEADGWVINRE